MDPLRLLEIEDRLGPEAPVLMAELGSGVFHKRLRASLATAYAIEDEMRSWVEARGLEWNALTYHEAHLALGYDCALNPLEQP